MNTTLVIAEPAASNLRHLGKRMGGKAAPETVQCSLAIVELLFQMHDEGSHIVIKHANGNEEEFNPVKLCNVES